MKAAIKKTIIFIIIIFINLLFFTACKTNEFEIGNDFFRKPTFKTNILKEANFVGNIGVVKDVYNIEIKCMCLLPIYEYSYKIEILDKNNVILKAWENTSSKDIKENTEFIEKFDLTYDEYINIDHINAEFKGKTKIDPNSLPEIKIPIETIYFNDPVIAMEINESIDIDIIKNPIDTDEPLIFRSSNEEILKIEKGRIIACKTGEAYLTAESKNGKQCYKNIKVLSKTTADDYQKIKDKAEKAILTIQNFCYDKNIFGNYTNSQTYKSTAIIFKQEGRKYYFITPQKNLKKLENYKYNSVTAKTYDNRDYNITIVKEEAGTSNSDYKLAIGYIESNNLGTLQFVNSEAYYKNERIFVKEYNTYQYATIYEYFSNVNNSLSYPIETTNTYKDIKIGAPIFNSDLNLIGMGVKRNAKNCLDFISSYKINIFIKQNGF